MQGRTRKEEEEEEEEQEPTDPSSLVFMFEGK